MLLTRKQKDDLKQKLTDCLKNEAEIYRIVIFGSFLTSDSPHDLDVAIYQNSKESYLPLAMKYRKMTRAIARTIPLDIFPIRDGCSGSVMLSEIGAGEIIYER